MQKLKNRGFSQFLLAGTMQISTFKNEFRKYSGKNFQLFFKGTY